MTAPRRRWSFGLRTLFMEKTGRRRWLQFTLREWLIFSACAGPALGWCAVRWNRAHHAKLIVEIINPKWFTRSTSSPPNPPMAKPHDRSQPPLVVHVADAVRGGDGVGRRHILVVLPNAMGR